MIGHQAPGESTESTEPLSLSSALVVGAGLIGTSAGLALRQAGVSVYLSDADPAAAALAADLGAGSLDEPPVDPDVVVLAVPPGAIVPVLMALQSLYVTSTFIDVASVKVKPQVEAEAAGADLTRWVGGHPMAGRERPGPAGARADLFVARPWVLTPSERSSGQSVARARALVAACGADLFEMTAERHDEAVALVSHVPQVVATLTAARLNPAGSDLVALAGQGIRDVTRIAASDPVLWTEILEANAVVVLAVLDELVTDLDAVRKALSRLAEKSTKRSSDSVPFGSGSSGSDPAADGGASSDGGASANGRASADSSARAELTRLLVEGNRGRARIPGKHGAARADYVSVPVVIPDEPGSLASLFVAAGEAGVNVEDVSIEHSPGQRVGLVELLVQPEAADLLAAALRESGWTVHYGSGG